MGTRSRLTLALTSGDIALPENGTIAVFAPTSDSDLSALPRDRCQLITGFKPDYDRFTAAGFTCHTEPEGRFQTSIIQLPRSKPLAQMLIAKASALTDELVIVDGAKTDGVESLLKACRKQVQIGAVLSKAHGKLFTFEAGAPFQGWIPDGPATIEGGYRTAPGVFSADGIDPASRLLADQLPRALGRVVADLGGGWGYLTARAAQDPNVQAFHLIEAEHAALTCARHNMTDPRVTFHWADATRWISDTPIDTILCNPPFHQGRKPDPSIGQGFIAAAASLLAPRGQLLLVANRHLPYETDLERHFTEMSEFGGDGRFKLLRAARPKRRGA